MDSVDVCAATSAGDKGRRVDKKNRDWNKRLHLRKTAVQPPAMQTEDKRGPKTTAEERERSTVWPSSKTPPRDAQESQRRTNDSGSTLRFACTQCKDNSEYVPKDLARHFEEKHRESPPVFSCHKCTFSTHDFSYLQVHLLSHKDTFSSCSICNDNVQRTWPEFSAHLTMCHCPNGKYSCEMCQKFSTGDVRVFLEHMFVHNLDLEGADDVDVSLHTKDKNQLSTTQTLRCQHCGYEASQKWLITKHIKAVHVCQNGNQRKKKKKEVHSIAKKPNDTIPKTKARLTRSAVREMCWLTQDCLSLPGREFLDKYCHLSDPQTTLEETQQFLMKSVAGETGDQKWTKALKTVLSNVPQDMNLHPKSENGIMTNSSDLTVLTVKNKITVAQNGATYAKRLKMMTSSEKETVSSESTAGDAQCALDQNESQSNLNDRAPCPQAENKLHNDVSVSGKNESECTRMQENRENQELKTGQVIEESSKKLEGPVHDNGICIPSDLKLTNECEETSIHKALPKNKKQNRRRRRRSRFNRKGKRSPGQPLKIVLKKNPVKEKQWVSQSSVSPSAGGSIDGHDGQPTPHAAAEETVQILQNVQPTEAHQKKWTKGSKTDLNDPSEAISSILQSKPGEELASSCVAKPVGSKNTTGNMPAVLKGSTPTHQEMQVDAKKSPQFLESEVDKSTSAGRTRQADPRDASATEAGMFPENVELQTSHSGTDCNVSEDKKSSAADGVTLHSSTSLPVPQPVITPQGEIIVEDPRLALSVERSERRVEGMRAGEVPAEPLGSIRFPADKAIQQEPSAASSHRWQPAPKHLERTLKLVAINSSQLVKRPAGDQPVVVLNHPDADIPEVARIMEVVNRYRGEVQKVVLSRRTLNALSASSGDVPETNDPTNAQTEAAWRGDNSVQERFSLKLKLRRLSRKKYEVVGAVSPGRDAARKFRCWFCGRMFTRRDLWMVHRQRHLMEWKMPNCENS